MKVNFERRLLKLSPDAVAALEWWIFKACKEDTTNLHIALLLRVLMDIYEKKIYPKVPNLKNTTTMKLSPVQAMALTIGLALFHWGGTAQQQMELFFIQEQLPQLRVDDFKFILPPNRLIPDG